MLMSEHAAPAGDLRIALRYASQLADDYREGMERQAAEQIVRELSAALSSGETPAEPTPRTYHPDPAHYDIRQDGNVEVWTLKPISASSSPTPGADSEDAEIERLRGALRDIASNYDHEEQTHDHQPFKYGGHCRVCVAERALAARASRTGGKV